MNESLIGWTLGIGTGEFNIHDQRLSSELGVSNIPSLCMVIRGRVYHYTEQDFTEANIKEFVRKSIPIERVVPKVDQILPRIANNSSFLVAKSR